MLKLGIGLEALKFGIGLEALKFGIGWDVLKFGAVGGIGMPAKTAGSGIGKFGGGIGAIISYPLYNGV